MNAESVLDQLKYDNDLKNSIKEISEGIGKFREDITSFTSTCLSAINELDLKLSLQWAISNVNLNSFECFTFNLTGYNDIQRQSSADIVTKILLAFMSDEGFNIDAFLIVSNQKNKENIWIEAKSRFHYAVSKQIHELTGVKPRISIADSKYFIYRN
jgi:hypothetical protein